MTGTSGTPYPSLALALEAIDNLTRQGLNAALIRGESAGLIAHSEINSAPLSQKTGPFYRHLLPLRKRLASLLGKSYRQYFKVALAHKRQTGPDPDEWARSQLQPAVRTALEWVRDWYILACDGENRHVHDLGLIPFVPGQTALIDIALIAPPIPPPKSWRAPAWLFAISLPLVGIGRLKTKHVPATNSEEKLSEAHTRLLLRGARRVFLWELEATIRTALNEETAAAGAIPAETVGQEKRPPLKRKGWEQKLKLYGAIREVLSGNPTLVGMEFCAELDKRHAPPLFDWTKSGGWPEGLTWKEAWGKPGLRKKIRRVRQEAMKRR